MEVMISPFVVGDITLNFTMSSTKVAVHQLTTVESLKSKNMLNYPLLALKIIAL